MIRKLFGTIKLLIGLSTVPGGFLLLYLLLQENANNGNLVIGNLVGFTLLEVYGLYIVYSGWTEFYSERKLKRKIIQSGMGFSLFMFFVMLWVIKNDTSEEMVLGGAITLGLIIFVGIRDGFMLKEVALNRSKKQVQDTASDASLR